MIKRLTNDEYIQIMTKCPRPKIYRWFDVSIYNLEYLTNECLVALLDNDIIFITKKEFSEEDLFWWSLTKRTTTNNID